MFIVELEEGVWLAPWRGDPGRTVVISNAKVFTSKKGANIALGLARKFRKFKNAMVIPFNNAQQPLSAPATPTGCAK